MLSYKSRFVGSIANCITSVLNRLSSADQWELHPVGYGMEGYTIMCTSSNGDTATGDIILRDDHLQVKVDGKEVKISRLEIAQEEIENSIAFEEKNGKIFPASWEAAISRYGKNAGDYVYGIFLEKNKMVAKIAKGDQLEGCKKLFASAEKCFIALERGL